MLHCAKKREQKISGLLQYICTYYMYQHIVAKVSAVIAAQKKCEQLTIPKRSRTNSTHNFYHPQSPKLHTKVATSYGARGMLFPCSLWPICQYIIYRYTVTVHVHELATFSCPKLKTSFELVYHGNLCVLYI